VRVLAAKVALMPDNHLGYRVPIRGVVAYRDAISPTGVGYDIGCGDKAVRPDMTGADLRPNVGRIMDEVAGTISFDVGRKNAEGVDSPVLDKAPDGWSLEATPPLDQKAVAQLGTVDSGNHNVDLFTDEEDRVWIGVHFGSRGLGHGVAPWFLHAAGTKDGMDVEPCVLDRQQRSRCAGSNPAALAMSLSSNAQDGVLLKRESRLDSG